MILHYSKNRDAVELDRAGGYYSRHVQAMTAEGLHAKSDIAAELACRDMEIDRLRSQVETLQTLALPISDTPQQVYRNGFRDGVAAYAYMTNGISYVGTTGRTLKAALESIEKTWNYSPPEKGS